MPWKWIEGETAMLVANLGTWPDTVEIEEEESELGMVEDWSIGRNGEIMNN